MATSVNDVGGGGPEADYGVATAATCGIKSFDAFDTPQEVFTREQIVEFQAAYDKCWNSARACMVNPDSSGPWERRIYQHFAGSKTAPLDKGLYSRVPFKQLSSKDPEVKGQHENQTESVVIRMGTGRYGFSHNMDKTVLSTHEATRPEPERKLLGSFLGPESEWHSYPGGLPAEGACGPGRWHRDTFSLWENEEMDGKIPPFYFTMIAPLTDVREEDGPTQFRLGSHLLSAAEVGAAPLASANLKAGDVILFDGRIVHRGGPRSQAAGARHALYIVHHKWWYTDDDMSPPVTKLEPLRSQKVALIEQEEPWTKVQRPSSFSRWKQFVLDDRVTFALSLAAAAMLGYASASATKTR